MKKLLLNDSFGGALLSAGAAADTDVSIDDELAVALGNSLDGAQLSAGTSHHASIGNLESHDNTSIFDISKNCAARNVSDIVLSS